MRRNLFITLIAITGMAITMAACGAIGVTGSGGGDVFFYSEEGFTMSDTGEICHYLEAAPYDVARNITWASSDYYNTDIAGTDTAIGTGRKNTALILATDANAPAARACKDYRGGGKSDWFLPSKDELNLLYENRAVAGSMKIRCYWSSSQYDTNSAWNQNFYDGYQYLFNFKHYDYGVRAIRAF